MAQTKRKRRTKHRGTAAGTIEARGRTSRPVAPADKKKQARVEARERRLNTPPTWKASVTRAGLASVFLFVVIALTQTKTKNRFEAAALFAVIAFVLYVPLGYYMESFMYQRRQRKLGARK
jgi:Flp pilus assembly protein TadB